MTQSGSGLLKRASNENQDFISKVAALVSEHLKPNVQEARPVSTNWSNFNLLPPSTSVIGTTDTRPPVHFDQSHFKNDDNDYFGTFNKTFI